MGTDSPSRFIRADKGPQHLFFFGSSFDGLQITGASFTVSKSNLLSATSVMRREHLPSLSQLKQSTGTVLK